MKQVAELYQKLTDEGKVRSICRYNLRRFCRSMDLPPCGISFWELDDLNWDYLQNLNRQLNDDLFWFRGGENFPRTYWDNHLLGHKRRTEFIFLTSGPQHHKPWRAFMERCFADNRKDFGQVQPFREVCDETLLAQSFKTAFTSDLIHFSNQGEAALKQLMDFYLSMILLTQIKTPPVPATRDDVFEAFKHNFPQHRSDITRITTTTETSEALDDCLYLLSKL